MSNLVDIMIDLETLGTAPGSVILSIGAAAAAADPDTHSFYTTISVSSALYAGLTVDPDTMSWWRKQAPEVWERQTQGGVHLPAALIALRVWIQEIRNGGAGASVGNRVRVWGDGASFDCVLLEEAYRRCHIAYPWSYTEVHYYRTLRQIKGSKKPIPKEHHNALSDAQAQLEHLRALLAS